MSRSVLMENGQQVPLGIAVSDCGTEGPESEISGLWLAQRHPNSSARFVATLRGHVGAVYRLTWSADSRMLISASKDSTVKVRNLIRLFLDFDSLTSSY
jgi:WD40 repeat protein